MDSGLLVWKVKLSLLAAAAVLAGLHEHERDATRERADAGRQLTNAHFVACLASVGHSGTRCSTGLKKPPQAGSQPAALHPRPAIEVTASAHIDD